MKNKMKKWTKQWKNENKVRKHEKNTIKKNMKKIKKNEAKWKKVKKVTFWDFLFGQKMVSIQF